MSSCTRLPAGVSNKWAGGLGAHIATLVAMLLLMLPEGANSARNQTSHMEIGSHRKARSYKASERALSKTVYSKELVFKAASRTIHPKLVLALAVVSTSNTGDIRLMPDEYQDTINAQEVFMAAATCNDGFLNMTQYMHAISSEKLKTESRGFVDFRDADLDSNDRVDLAEFLFAWATSKRFLAARPDGTGFVQPCDLEKVYGDAANTLMVFDAYPKDGKLSRAEFLHVMIAWAQFGLLTGDSVSETGSSQAGNKKVTAPVLTSEVMMFHTARLSETPKQTNGQEDPAKVKLDSKEAADMTALFPVFTRLTEDGEVTQRELSMWVLLTDTDRDDSVDLYEFLKYAVSVTKPPASWQSHQEELRERTKARAVAELLKAGPSNGKDWDMIVGLILVDMLTDRDSIVTDDDVKEVDRFKQIFDLLSDGSEDGLKKDQYQQQCKVSPHGEFFPAFENVDRHNKKHLDFLEFLLASKTAEIFASQLKPHEEPILALPLMERAFGEEIAKQLVGIVPGQNQLDPASLLEALRVWFQFVILDQDNDGRIAQADLKHLAGIQEANAENGIEKDTKKGIGKDLFLETLPLFADSFGPLSDSGISEQNIKEWFAKLNADEDGYVTLPDMIRSVADKKHAEMKGLRLSVPELIQMVDEGKLSMRMAINLLMLDLVDDGDGIVGLKEYLGLQTFQKGRDNGNLDGQSPNEEEHNKVKPDEIEQRIREGLLAKFDKNENKNIDESELMQILQELLTDMDWLVQRLTDFWRNRGMKLKDVLEVIKKALKAKLLMHSSQVHKRVEDVVIETSTPNSQEVLENTPVDQGSSREGSKSVHVQKKPDNQASAQDGSEIAPNGKKEGLIKQLSAKLAAQASPTNVQTRIEEELKKYEKILGQGGKEVTDEEMNNIREALNNILQKLEQDGHRNINEVSPTDVQTRIEEELETRKMLGKNGKKVSDEEMNKLRAALKHILQKLEKDGHRNMNEASTTNVQKRVQEELQIFRKTLESDGKKVSEEEMHKLQNALENILQKIENEQHTQINEVSQTEMQRLIQEELDKYRRGTKAEITNVVQTLQHNEENRAAEAEITNVVQTLQHNEENRAAEVTNLASKTLVQNELDQLGRKESLDKTDELLKNILERLLKRIGDEKMEVSADTVKDWLEEAKLKELEEAKLKGLEVHNNEAPLSQVPNNGIDVRKLDGEVERIKTELGKLTRADQAEDKDLHNMLDRVQKAAEKEIEKQKHERTDVQTASSDNAPCS